MMTQYVQVLVPTSGDGGVRVCFKDHEYGTELD